MEFDKIVYFLIKASSVIFAIVFFVMLFSNINFVQRDYSLERFSAQIAEAILSSELTTDKYVFDSSRLHALTHDDSGEETEQGELPFVRSSKFAYRARIEDLETGDEWEFGYDGSNVILTNVIEDFTRSFSASINSTGGETYYDTVHQARLDITAYHTKLTDAGCKLEAAFVSKKIRKTKCFEGNPCFSLRRNGDKACVEPEPASGSQDNVPLLVFRECRYMPEDIEFVDTFISTQDLLDNGIQPDKADIVFYPLRAGAPRNCGVVKNNPEQYLPGDQETEVVLICAE